MKTSKGEAKIAEILQKADIPFRREVGFKDLRSLKHKAMRFDFVIYADEKYNDDEIIAIVEFDGEQHFFFNKFFSKSEQAFKYRQELDLLKNEYCLAHNYRLFRIPYYDYDRLINADDLYKQEYRVTTKWHNHNLVNKLKNHNT